MIKITQLVFLFLFPMYLSAQSVDLNRTITLKYNNQRLGYILSDLSRKYGIPFSYSSNFIPVAKRITIRERDISLEEGLNKLFAPTQIVYAIIGNSIALKIDASKEVIPIIEKPIERKQKIESEEIPLLKKSSFPVLVWEHQIPEEVLEKMKNPPPVPTVSEVPDSRAGFMEKQMIQVTLVPPISTNEELAEKTTNTFSFNILWGRNGGLNGIEIGGFVNTITNNMQGFQLAGVGNQIGGDMQGGQLATIFNYNQGFTKGVQASLFNIANRANVIQLAGIANIIQGDFDGLQAAIVGNYTKNQANGIQSAGLLNYSEGKANMQFSLGLNKAAEVNNLQVGLINVAKKVNGRQLGLVNISETAEHTPFGLFNYVKNGYNKIEVGGNEVTYGTIGYKSGTRKFYNIFQVGSPFIKKVWSLGYGFGTAFKLKEKQHLHLEYIASHVNENEFWTKELNLLNQFKFNFDWQFRGNSSFFIGPSWNLLASKRKNVETLAVVGSDLPPYTILDKTARNTNWKMWFGLSGGIRF